MFGIDKPFEITRTCQFQGIGGTTDCICEIAKTGYLSDVYGDGFLEVKTASVFWEAPLRLALSAQFRGYIDSPHGTQRDIGFLTACPTLAERQGARTNWRNLSPIENYGNKLPINHTFFGLSKEAVCENAIIFFRYFGYFRRTPPIKGSPVICEQFCPFLCDRVNALLPSEILRHRTNSDSGYVGIAPFTDRDVIDRISQVRGVPSSGEQRLMVKCSKFALRVVWWPVTIRVYSSAVSRYDKFIFREVDDNDRTGTNLGVCRVSSEDDRREYERKFYHVIVRTGNASIWTGTVCYGCTILTSPDAKIWYEIIAVHFGHYRIIESLND